MKLSSLRFVGAGAGISLVALALGIHAVLPEAVVRPILWPIYVVLFRGVSFWEVIGDGRAGSPVWWAIAFLLNSIFIGGVLWLLVRGVNAARRRNE